MSLEPQPQPVPGLSARMHPEPDYGEESYRGSGRLAGRAAIITGGDSGIGRAVALAYAREGADVLISYLPEEQEDADETRRLVEAAGRRCKQVPGDLQDHDYCRALVDKAVEAFGRLDILVNNAAFQTTRDRIEDIGWDEWRKTWAINVDAMFLLSQAALPHMKAGASIINTTSVNSDDPPPVMSVYDATKAAIANFTASLGALVAERGIRVNSVAPGPIWTPLIVSTMPPGQMDSFGSKTPMKRPGQPAEVAPLYVWLASDDASYVTGARYAVTGGLPIL
jgi:hypothetical protein